MSGEAGDTTMTDTTQEPLFVKREDAKWTPPEEPEESPLGVEVTEEEGPLDDEIKKIEKEKVGLTARQVLDTALEWKTRGNDMFKQSLNDNAADCYFRGVVYARGLLQNPKWYPEMKHTVEEYNEARQLCEAMFTNLAMAQIRYAGDLGPEDSNTKAKMDQDMIGCEITTPKVALEEAARSADEALKLNAKNEKALYRRGIALSRVADLDTSIESALNTLARAKQDFLALQDIQGGKNRDTRAGLQTVNEQLRSLKKKQTEGEKKVFAFGQALSAIDTKAQNIGDGGVKKVLKAGEGGNWFDPDWLLPTWPGRCVVTVLKDTKPMSFTLSTDRLSQCVRTMSLNEEASFTFKDTGDASFTLTFLRHEFYKLNPGGLEKVFEEGYGEAPVPLAEVSAHFRVISSAGTLLFNSRWKCDLGNMNSGKDLMNKSEDPDKPPLVWTWGENCPWAPLECARVKQGGRSEIRLAEKPPELDVDRIFPSGSSENVMIKMDLKKEPWSAGTIVMIELLRVSLPIESADDSRFCDQTIAREEVAAAMLASNEELAAAERRFRRAIKFSRETGKEPQEATLQGLAGVLLRMALPVVNGGNVTSKELKVAQERVEEARPLVTGDSVLSNVCKARLRLCDDDDFEEALRYLELALKQDPHYADAQALFRECKVHQQRHARERTAVDLAKAQQLLRNSKVEDGLTCLEDLRDCITWEAIMETKIGVEVKALAAHENPDIRKRAERVLSHWHEISKQERPMW